MSKVLPTRMKTNHFQLIPEECEMEKASADPAGSSGGQEAAALAAAQQAAIAARILQAQQNHLGAGTGNLSADLAFQQQFFNHHQFLQHKMLEEQLNRNRDFLLMSEAEREKQIQQGVVFHQVIIICDLEVE